MSDYFLFFLRRVTRPVLPEPIIVMMRPAMPAVAPVATAAVVAAAAVVEVAEEVLPDDVFFVSVLEFFLVTMFVKFIAHKIKPREYKTKPFVMQEIKTNKV